MSENMQDTQALRERCVLELLGTIPNEDCHREGLKETPKRVAKMYGELFSGYQTSFKDIFKAVFRTDNDSMVVVKDIDYYSLCEHHMVPFFGKAHIGYIPNGKVLGLSKFARLVDAYSKRLQIQEQMTYQIAGEIDARLEPKGVIVVVEGFHMCMSMRGIKKPNSKTVTSHIRGVFEKLEVRQEFFNTLKLN